MSRGLSKKVEPPPLSSQRHSHLEQPFKKHCCWVVIEIWTYIDEACASLVTFCTCKTRVSAKEKAHVVLSLCIYIYLLCCIWDVQDKTRHTWYCHCVFIFIYCVVSVMYKTRQGTRHCLDIRWSFSVVTTASLSLTESLSIISRTSTPGYFHSDIQSANLSFFLFTLCWRWNSN